MPIKILIFKKLLFFVTIDIMNLNLLYLLQPLDTIRIKQDHFIRHQSNFTAPVRLPTYINLRYNKPLFPQYRQNFLNSPIPSINQNSRTTYQPLRDRRYLLNFLNHVHKPTNYIYSHPRQQNQQTAPQSHYINNRILHHAIINKLTSPKTKSSFNQTTNKYELRKITSDGKTDWISNPVMFTSKDFVSWTTSYKSYTDRLLHFPTTSKLSTKIQQPIAPQLSLSSQLPSASQPISPNNNKLLKNNLKISLLNIQSLNNKPDLVHSLDTWSTEYSTPNFIAATPKTHFFINYSRASRAGGVAAIIHNSITLLKQTNSTINSIELTHIQLTHKSANISTDLNLILRYRPPSLPSPLNTIYDILNDVHDKIT